MKKNVVFFACIKNESREEQKKVLLFTRGKKLFVPCIMVNKKTKKSADSLFEEIFKNVIEGATFKMKSSENHEGVYVGSLISNHPIVLITPNALGVTKAAYYSRSSLLREITHIGKKSRKILENPYALAL